MLKVTELLRNVGVEVRDLLEEHSIYEVLLHTFACDCAERVMQKLWKETGRLEPRSQRAIAQKRAWIAKRIPASSLLDVRKEAHRAVMEAIRERALVTGNSPLRYVCGAAMFCMKLRAKDAALDASAEAARAVAWYAAEVAMESVYPGLLGGGGAQSSFLLGPPPSLATETSGRDSVFRTAYDRAYEAEVQWQREHLAELIERHAWREELVSGLRRRQKKLREKQLALEESFEDALF